MDKYLTIFESHSQYVNPEVKPNVSYCIQEDEVHYSPYTDPRLIATINVTDTSNSTYIMRSNMQNQFSEIEIDGIVLLNVSDSYVFDTTGEHIVKYTLINNTNIEANTFEYCLKLTSITIPESITSIGSNAFNGISNLIAVHIYDLKAWCKITFSSSNSNPLLYAHHLYLNGKEIRELIIPNSVTSIGNYAFTGCTGLTSVTIPNFVTSIGNQAFSRCSNLVSVSIGNSVTSMGEYVFYQCSNLSSLIIGNSLTNIGKSAFSECTSLISVTIPNSVINIEQSAFNGCNSLTSVIIPLSVTNVGGAAFYDCSNLTSITCYATTAPTIGSATFRNVGTNGTLTVPTGSTGYNVWMGTGSYYLGLYSWTKVEQ